MTGTFALHELSLHVVPKIGQFANGSTKRAIALIDNMDSGVRKAIRRGSAEEEVRKHRNRVTGAWKQISKQRRRVDVSYDLTALHHGIWMDEEGFKRLVSERRKKRETSTSLSTVYG